MSQDIKGSQPDQKPSPNEPSKEILDKPKPPPIRLLKEGEKPKKPPNWDQLFSIKVTFTKDEDEYSKTKDMYWVVVKNPDNSEITSDLFTENEVQELKQYAKMEGLTGRMSLHEWLKRNRPAFFKKAVTDKDPYGVVNKLIQEIQHWSQS